MSSFRRVHLPDYVSLPVEVYVNGVRQQEGQDYTVIGRSLQFEQPLAKEGRLGMRRWTLGAFGIGTYRPHHTVDVRYTGPDGRSTLAHDLPVAAD